jgi:hypothetical protein
MDGKDHGMANARNRCKRVSPEPQMGFITQEFQGMPFRLKREFIGVGFSIKDDIFCQEFHTLASAGGFDKLALYRQAGTGIDPPKDCRINGIGLHDHLQILYRRAIVERNEDDILALSFGSYPTFGNNFPVDFTGQQEFFDFGSVNSVIQHGDFFEINSAKVVNQLDSWTVGSWTIGGWTTGQLAVGS